MRWGGERNRADVGEPVEDLQGLEESLVKIASRPAGADETDRKHLNRRRWRQLLDEQAVRL
jgi:hypothetical protein